MHRRLNEQQKLLVEATKNYHSSLAESPAETYLAERGLNLDRVERFRFGYVDSPEPGHERYRGMLAIPYLRRDEKGSWLVVSMKFRCIETGCDHSGHGGGKYLGLPGVKPRMFNTVALIDNHDRVAVAEGEIDAVVATLAGIPAVGLPGANMWRPHFREAFIGYRTVFGLLDADSAGRALEKKLSTDLGNFQPHAMPEGEDVNSFVLANGARALRERIRWE